MYPSAVTELGWWKNLCEKTPSQAHRHTHAVSRIMTEKFVHVKQIFIMYFMCMPMDVRIYLNLNRMLFHSSLHSLDLFLSFFILSSRVWHALFRTAPLQRNQIGDNDDEGDDDKVKINNRIHRMNTVSRFSAIIDLFFFCIFSFYHLPPSPSLATQTYFPEFLAQMFMCVCFGICWARCVRSIVIVVE